MNVDRRQIGWMRWLSWQAAGLVYRPLARLAFRPVVTGLEQVPDGGYLLLANHTAMLDNLWVAAPLHRVVHIMTGAGRFRSPVAGGLLRWFNCFPKQVGGRDASATDQVKRLLDADQVVHIMPEGTRTWDGRLQTIRPSIGKLAAAGGKPVVLCKVTTGHLFWPRWADRPRWGVPIHLEYQVIPTLGVDPQTLWRRIVDGLTLDEPVRLDSISAPRCAEHLESFLWACPRCFARSTHSRGQTFGCASCGASWQVTVDNRMQGEEPLTVAEAWDRIAAHFGHPPVIDGDAVLRGEVELTDTQTGEQVFRGELTLDEDTLRSQGWTLALRDLQRVYMDTGNVVILRTEQGKIKLAPQGDDAGWMWFCALEPRTEARHRRDQRAPAT